MVNDGFKRTLDKSTNSASGSRTRIPTTIALYPNKAPYTFMLLFITVFIHKYSQGCSFCAAMYFSSFRLSTISAPYLPTEPLSTRRKYACRLFRTASFDLEEKEK